MNAARFHNSLRILLNLDQHDLAAAGVIDGNWGSAEASARDQVEAFMDDPIREALRMPDANFQQLFALIETRQPKQKPPSFGPYDARSDAELATEIERLKAIRNDTDRLIEAMIDRRRVLLGGRDPKSLLEQKSFWTAARADGGADIVTRHFNIVGMDAEDRSGESRE